MKDDIKLYRGWFTNQFSRAVESPQILGWAAEQGKAQMREWVWAGINSWLVSSAHNAGCFSGSRLMCWAQEMKILALQGPNLPVWRKPTLLPTRYLCSLGWPWHFWLVSKHRCGLELWHRLLGSAGEIRLPQVPGVAGSEGAVVMEGFSKRCLCPEHQGAFCFPFPCLCYSRRQWSFSAPYCCNLHMNDNTAQS